MIGNSGVCKVNEMQWRIQACWCQYGLVAECMKGMVLGRYVAVEMW